MTLLVRLSVDLPLFPSPLPILMLINLERSFLAHGLSQTSVLMASPGGSKFGCTENNDLLVNHVLRWHEMAL